MEEDAVETVNAVEPDETHTAMADEVAATKEVVATKAADGEAMTTETMATEAVTAETMAAAMASETAGIGDLRQRDEHGDEHCKHQIEQLTTHDTLLFWTVFSRRHRRARIVAKLRPCRSYLSQ
jgi:hypothetical protein